MKYLTPNQQDIYLPLLPDFFVGQAVCEPCHAKLRRCAAKLLKCGWGQFAALAVELGVLPEHRLKEITLYKEVEEEKKKAKTGEEEDNEEEEEEEDEEEEERDVLELPWTTLSYKKPLEARPGIVPPLR